MLTQQGSIDLERLLKLRVVVARVDEMDLAPWWSTKNQLDRSGASTLRRGSLRALSWARSFISAFDWSLR